MGNLLLAREFAELTSSAFGALNFSSTGPLLATGSNASSNSVGCYYLIDDSQASCSPYATVTSNVVHAYATEVSSVPAPAAFPLALTALGVAGLFSRRRR